MSQRYSERPSVLLRIEDEYDAYCLDEACALIMKHLDEKEEPMFTKKEAGAHKYRLPSELYAKYDN